MTKLSRRNFGRVLAAAAAWTTLPASSVTAILAQTRAKENKGIDPMSLVDPELRPALEAALKWVQPSPRLEDMTTAAQFAAFRKSEQLPISFLAQPPVAERTVAVGGRVPDVQVFVINARPGTRRPAILHTHGGGFVLGSAREDVPNLQPMAQSLDCVIVTVEYGLAPEVRAPVSTEQNYGALKWLYKNADELGVDRSRIALAGESAGGGHAAMLAIAARNRGEVPVIYQSLACPMLDDRTASTRDPAPHIGTFMWTRALNRMGWRSLLGHAPGGSSAGTVPAREANLAGLPATWIGTGAIDLFVDEDVEFARRLIDAGVSTELLVSPGAYHAFDGMVPGASVSKAFTQSRLSGLARAFGARQS
jgi:acetyl esterase/lipase